MYEYILLRYTHNRAYTLIVHMLLPSINILLLSNILPLSVVTFGFQRVKELLPIWNSHQQSEKQPQRCWPVLISVFGMSQYYKQISEETCILQALTSIVVCSRSLYPTSHSIANFDQKYVTQSIDHSPQSNVQFMICCL